MRTILMLGWEFAPARAGGFGVATAGLAQALAADPELCLHMALPHTAGADHIASVAISSVAMHYTGSIASTAYYPGCYDANLTSPVPVPVPTPAFSPTPLPSPASPVPSPMSEPVSEPAPTSVPSPTDKDMFSPACREPFKDYCLAEPFAKHLNLLHNKYKSLWKGVRGRTSFLQKGFPRPPEAYQAQIIKNCNLIRPSSPSPTLPPPDFAAAVAAYTRATVQLDGSEVHADIVHAHDWITVPAALQIQQQTPAIPLVMHVHSLEADRRGDQPDPQIAALEQQGTAAADLVMTVSNYERRRIVRDCGVAWARIKVVYNGINCAWWQRRARWRLYCPPFAPRVVFAGRMAWQKDPFSFIEMARLIKDQLPQVRFTMAGDGELLAAVKHRCWELGLALDVDFPGFVRHEQLADIFAQASVLVMPSRSEPFGMVALEASACEVPVVLSHCCGVREVLPELIEVAPGDVAGFAQATLTVLRRPREQQRAVYNRLAAQRLSWPAAAAATAAHYQSLSR